MRAATKAGLKSKAAGIRAAEDWIYLGGVVCEGAILELVGTPGCVRGYVGFRPERRSGALLTCECNGGRGCFFGEAVGSSSGWDGGDAPATAVAEARSSTLYVGTVSFCSCTRWIDGVAHTTSGECGEVLC